MSKEDVLAVLKRAADDASFYSQLSQDYTAALEGYDLPPEEAMHIGKGDVQWIESHINAKIDKQIMEKVYLYLYCREKCGKAFGANLLSLLC